MSKAKASRSTVRFTEADGEWLCKEADRLGVSIADVIRMALVEYRAKGDRAPVVSTHGRTLNLSGAVTTPPSDQRDKQMVSGFGWDEDE
jgi:hypothetical protein